MAKKDDLRNKRQSGDNVNAVGPPAGITNSDLLNNMISGGNYAPPPNSELLEEHEKLKEHTEALQEQNEALQSEVEVLHDVVDKAIVPESQEGVFYYKRFAITKTGLAFPEDGDVSQDEWLDVGLQLKKLDESIQWNLGDLCEFARYAWGMTYDDMAQRLDYEEQTLRTYAYVAQAVDPLIRINSLSHAHHRLVASIRRKDGTPDTEMQGEWLHRAAENNWTLAEFRKQLKGEKPRLPASSPLADPKNRKVFNRVWRSLEAGATIQQDDIVHLERWLAEVKSQIH